jgi:beta-phosphoglucomutase-like phosphatase (HAD superfamily)
VLFETGRFLSSFGSSLSAIAYPLLVLALTHSPAKAGIVTFARTIPLPLFSLVAGAAADRGNRKRQMLVADAIRFVLATKAAGISVAAASSSKNADLLLRQVRLDAYVAEPDLTLLDLLDADVSGRDLPRGKPDPAIFLFAAEELGAPPARCFAVEDASAGVQAAKAGGFAALGVARLGDTRLLADAGADLVVRSLDEVSRPALAEGLLKRKRNGEA